MQPRHLGETFHFHGDGASRERALVVRGLRCAEMLGRAKEQLLLAALGEPAGGAALVARFGLPLASRLGARRGWHVAQQMSFSQDGRRYHLLLVTLADGTPRLFWFDVTGVA